MAVAEMTPPITDRQIARKLRRVSNAKTLGNNLINASLIEYNRQVAQRSNTNGDQVQYDQRSPQRVSINAKVHVQAEPGSSNILLTVETPSGTFSAYI